MNNFEFEHEGKKYWYSRSIAAVAFIFAKDLNGTMHVLANKRGPGAPNEIGKWNCPCGYLDFNETVAECAVREIFEETGVQLKPTDIHLVSINDNPNDSKSQNVTFRFIGSLNTTIESYELNNTNSEKDEVDEIKWIPLDNIGEYDWAFNHYELIKSNSIYAA